MKRFCLVGLVLLLFVAPLSLSAQVEPLAGSMSIGVLVDFAGRYSAEDQKDPDPDEVYWPGYETFNLEEAIIYIKGKVGDNVSYVIGHCLVIPGYSGDVVTPNGTSVLFDAKITYTLTESIALTMGRYNPGTSMSVSPHRFAKHHLIDPPMFIKNGGYQFSLISLPRYQSGVGITAKMGPAKAHWNFINGDQLMGPTSTYNDVDKCKGGVLKVAVDSGNLHAGAFYLNEQVYSMTSTAIGPVSFLDEDADVSQWGIEVSYTTERLLAQAEYVNYVVDFMDNDALVYGVLAEDVPNLNQLAYYLLLGTTLGPVDLFFRYEFAEGGYDEFLDNFDDGDVDEDQISDNQTNYAFGVNYDLNDNTTVALNYTLKQPEEWEGDFDGDGDTEDMNLPNINELAVMVELSVL